MGLEHELRISHPGNILAAAFPAPFRVARWCLTSRLSPIISEAARWPGWRRPQLRDGQLCSVHGMGRQRRGRRYADTRSPRERRTSEDFRMKALQEFKEFAVKGNVIDMAVGVVIGAGFGKIVSSLVGDIITPVLGILVGGVNFTNLKVTLKDAIADKPAVTWN